MKVLPNQRKKRQQSEINNLVGTCLVSTCLNKSNTRMNTMSYKKAIKYATKELSTKCLN